MATIKYADWPEERKARSRENTKKWQARNKNKIIESRKRNRAHTTKYNKEWRARNRDKTREYYKRYTTRQQKWYKENYGHLVTYYKDYNCKKKYGISYVKKLEILASQGGTCAICRVATTNKNRELVVDHNHETNSLRGILCQPCNLLLGAARDDIRILQRAIGYLEKHSGPSQERADALLALMEPLQTSFTNACA